MEKNQQKPYTLITDGQTYKMIDRGLSEAPELPVGVYTPNYAGFGQINLLQQSSLPMPSKLYLTPIDEQFVEQCLKTFSTFDRNIGVLLEGQRGTGKTVTAKLLAQKANLPIIMVDKKIPDAQYDLISFLKSIKQDFVLFIDEFEKIFSDSQVISTEDFLSFTDGTSNADNKVLFIFTCNEGVNENFYQRPGRVRYYRKYKGIDEMLARRIITEELNNQDHQEDLIDNLNFHETTSDILLSIISEMNLHEKKYTDFKSFFNYTTENPVYKMEVRLKPGQPWVDMGTIEDAPDVMAGEEYLSKSHRTWDLSFDNELYKDCTVVTEGYVMKKHNDELNQLEYFVNGYVCNNSYRDFEVDKWVREQVQQGVSVTKDMKAQAVAKYAAYRLHNASQGPGYQVRFTKEKNTQFRRVMAL